MGVAFNLTRCLSSTHMLSVCDPLPTMASMVTPLGERRRYLRMSPTDTKTGPILRPRTEIQAEERDRQIQWIDWVERQTGLSDTALAKATSSSNTITRFRNRDGAVLLSRTVRAICEFTGLPGPDAYKMSGASGAAKEGIPFDPGAEGQDQHTAALIGQAVAGRPGAEAWTLATRALESAGYLVGDYVICDKSTPATAGDAVMAYLIEAKTGQREPVFRIFIPPYLVTATSDPEIRRPLLVDNDRVIVHGPITESFRSRNR